MMNKNAFYALQTAVAVLLSVLAWFGCQIHAEQKRISERLRTLELNQVKIMTEFNIEPVKLSGDVLDFFDANYALGESKQSNNKAFP